ncbi:HTH-type transcriptional regulator mtrR [Actinoplanes sp. SE50]|uniref:TetR/AcrR family transcriptional regulator n=1 Tax=unclassified Actinoplanes TaxID=2626549 RepID=UPI00023ECD06|nr:MULTISPECIES: TetR/AcrR family transcriptional regulator [unclassified Actinoplanes]AEV85473.1 HTH-type transcriptional regulator mtrR [Actinoplanes sp. SE50/110]ATO83866.1 HTH-type transcriptional regulator mtrR [Actinoplanes sp. SE50]SLM01276.1 TetR family transcriptional regulator [Actinoplanes sp. SE50/110]
MDENLGLRERKKMATRMALHEAAVRLAAERGADNVTIDAIAESAGVSRRTFTNYFANKEEVFYYREAHRMRRLCASISAQPTGDPWTVLTGAALELMTEAATDPSDLWLKQRRELHRDPHHLAHQIAAYTAIEKELAALIADRVTGPDADLRARVLVAQFMTAFRSSVQYWMEHPETSLPETFRKVTAMVATVA